MPNPQGPEHKEGRSRSRYAGQPSLPDIQAPLLAMARIQASGMKRLLQYQTEALSFLSRRAEQDLKLVEKLGEANALTEVYDACTAFCQDAMSQYSAEAGKIVDIGSKIASETVIQAKKEAEQAAKPAAEPATVSRAA